MEEQLKKIGEEIDAILTKNNLEIRVVHNFALVPKVSPAKESTENPQDINKK